MRYVVIDPLGDNVVYCHDEAEAVKEAERIAREKNNVSYIFEYCGTCTVQQTVSWEGKVKPKPQAASASAREPNARLRDPLAGAL